MNTKHRELQKGFCLPPKANSGSPMALGAALALLATPVGFAATSSPRPVAAPVAASLQAQDPSPASVYDPTPRIPFATVSLLQRRFSVYKSPTDKELQTWIDPVFSLETKDENSIFLKNNADACRIELGIRLKLTELERLINAKLRTLVEEPTTPENVPNKEATRTKIPAVAYSDLVGMSVDIVDSKNDIVASGEASGTAREEVVRIKFNLNRDQYDEIVKEDGKGDLTVMVRPVFRGDFMQTAMANYEAFNKLVTKNGFMIRQNDGNSYFGLGQELERDEKGILKTTAKINLVGYSPEAFKHLPPNMPELMFQQLQGAVEELRGESLRDTLMDAENQRKLSEALTPGLRIEWRQNKDVGVNEEHQEARKKEGWYRIDTEKGGAGFNVGFAYAGGEGAGEEKKYNEIESITKFLNKRGFETTVDQNERKIIVTALRHKRIGMSERDAGISSTVQVAISSGAARYISDAVIIHPDFTTARLIAAIHRDLGRLTNTQDYNEMLPEEARKTSLAYHRWLIDQGLRKQAKHWLEALGQWEQPAYGQPALAKQPDGTVKEKNATYPRLLDARTAFAQLAHSLYTKGDARLDKMTRVMVGNDWHNIWSLSFSIPASFDEVVSRTEVASPIPFTLFGLIDEKKIAPDKVIEELLNDQSGVVETRVYEYDPVTRVDDVAKIAEYLKILPAEVTGERKIEFLRKYCAEIEANQWVRDFDTQRMLTLATGVATFVAAHERKWGYDREVYNAVLIPNEIEAVAGNLLGRFKAMDDTYGMGAVLEELLAGASARKLQAAKVREKAVHHDQRVLEELSGAKAHPTMQQYRPNQ